MELVSVIVPVYNVEAYLVRCLDSIAAQSFSNIEVILVDDGSTDSSGALCDDYCLKDSRFRVIHQENQWLAGARNTGISAAKGDFLLFVDSDDAIHPLMIERLFESMRESGASFVICGHRWVSDLSEPFEKIEGPVKYETIDYRECVRRLCIEFGMDSEYGLAWNKLIPRKLVEGMFFESIYANEDVTYSLRLMLHSERVAVLEDELYYYTLRDGSIMRSKDAWNKWLFNHTIMRGRCLDYIPESEPTLRGYALFKLYRRMLSSRSALHGTEHENAYEEIIKAIVGKTRKEYLGHKGISVMDKALFLVSWSFPALGRLVFKALGN